MRAFQVPGDQHQLLAGTLRKGDRVDLVASIKVDPNGDQYKTRVVLRDIEVLKAAPATTTGPKVTQSAASNSVLLAVTDTQVPKLLHVLEHGKWSLELRPPIKANDSPETIVDGLSIMRDGLRGKQLEQLQVGGTP